MDRLLGSFATIGDLRLAYTRRALSPVEFISDVLQSTKLANSDLHAFLAINEEGALAAARKAERYFARDRRLPPLFGVPIAVKDAELTAGIRTTFGSRAFRDYVPELNTIHVERLVRAGAIVIGKTNTPEFTLLGETYNQLMPDCSNPVDRCRTVGGSSGGSAAAVAAGLVPLATGTDTAGSITIPAAFCGVFGLKPTHRLIPVWPNWNDWSLLYDVGPITRTVADAALALSVTAGSDSRDPYARCEGPKDYTAILSEAVPVLRIAWAPTIGDQPVDPACADAVACIAGRLAQAGHKVVQAAPHVGPAGHIAEIIGAVEEFRVRGHLLRRADQLCPETVSILCAGRDLPPERYSAALAERQALAVAFDDFFRSFDLLLVPATACPAFPMREPPDKIDGRKVQTDWVGFAPFNMYGSLIGGPVASVPAGAAKGLPLGVLVFAAPGRDQLVLQASNVIETMQ